MRLRMSSPHWETSKRPLFVKSVWTNGYRHVILSKEDPVIKSKRSSLIRSIKSGKIINSARSKTTSNTDESLMIPAVQLLLAKVHRIKSTPEKKPDHPRLAKSLTFNVLATDHVKIRNVDVEVNLTPNIKHASGFNSIAGVSYDNKMKMERLEHCANSLTERVLLWLDLAGRYRNEICKNEEDNNKRSRTMRKCSKRFASAHPEQKNNDHLFVRKCSKNSNFTQQRDETYDEPYIEDYSILQANKKVFTEQSDDYLVTSQLEIVPSVISKSSGECMKKCSQTLSKRQVHIFMPHVAKRLDTNSIISASTESELVPSVVKDS